MREETVEAPADKITAYGKLALATVEILHNAEKDMAGADCVAPVEASTVFTTPDDGQWRITMSRVQPESAEEN